VEVSIKLEELTKLKFVFSYTVTVNGELKAKGRTSHCVIKNGKPVKLPEKFYNILMRLEPQAV